MIEVTDWLIDCALMLFTWMRDNPFEGILSFVLFYPVIKLFARLLKAIINR